jgi:hypothetical protein
MSDEVNVLREQLNKILTDLKDRTPTDEERSEVRRLVSEIKLHQKAELPDSGESRGFGDTIKKVTNKLGIKQCGACKKRQLKLNKLFPYK